MIAQDPPQSWYAAVPFERLPARYIWWGVAIHTRQSYQTALNSYTNECAFRRTPPFPATVQSLASWVASLGHRRLQVKSIKSYITGVRSAQLDIGATRAELEVFHHPSLERLVNGIKRLQGEAGRRERRPITRPILLQMLALLNQDTLHGATFQAAFSLAFAAFLRIGEFTHSAAELNSDPSEFQEWHVTRGSIFLEKDWLELSLPASRTDPFRHGITITVAASHDAGCAVASLRHLFRRFPSRKTAPLFNTDTGFTRQFFTNTLRQILSDLGYTGHYAGHSFRRGAATWAKEMGLTDREIQLLVRWKSNSYLLYIDTSPAVILNASRRQQL